MSTPVGPYSAWRRAGDFVILSGQIGLVPGAETPTMIDDTAPGQLRQALTNADFPACNEVWLEFFNAPRPTRSTIGIAQLPFGARAEAELWAYAPEA